MKESTWIKIKEFNEIATKSLPPDIFEHWSAVMDHYKFVHFEKGTYDDTRTEAS